MIRGLTPETAPTVSVKEYVSADDAQKFICDFLKSIKSSK
jgi:hypothetical protein